jgi:hypothetical protein
MLSPGTIGSRAAKRYLATVSPVVMLGNRIDHDFIGHRFGKFAVAPMAAKTGCHQRVAVLVNAEELAVGQGAYQHELICPFLPGVV